MLRTFRSVGGTAEMRTKRRVGQGYFDSRARGNHIDAHWLAWRESWLELRGKKWANESNEEVIVLEVGLTQD